MFQERWRIMANQQTEYDDVALCKDLAKADLSIQQIADKHNISARQVYRISNGESRPELKVRIDELIQAERAAGMRLARSRGRWFVGRLIQLAAKDDKVGLDAVVKGMEVAGMLTRDGGGDDKQTIEIVLSTSGNDKVDPLAERLTGVLVSGDN